MPVITRSQSLMKNNVASLEKCQDRNFVINQKINVKVSPNMDNLLPWFTSVAKEYLADIEKNRQKNQILYCVVSECKNEKMTKKNKNIIRTNYFDNIRRATELMFFVDKYLPEVYNLSPKMPNFAKCVYNKVQEFYQDIYNSSIKPETDEERKVISSLIYTIQDVEKNIIPLLPTDQQLKRKRNVVDYTGMDTIEGLDIWADVTIAEDPDYVPDDYDDEDDELDRYVVYNEEDEDNFEQDEEPEEDEYDYSEDEDYIADDEDYIPEDEDVLSQPYKIIKIGNHTRFIYDDDE